MKTKPITDGMDDRMQAFTIRATARSVRRRNIMLKIVIIILLILILLLGSFYALSAFVNKAGNFTVWISDEDLNQITLSDTADFEVCASLLEADVIEQMDNTTIVLSNQKATVDQFLNMMIERK